MVRFDINRMLADLEALDRGDFVEAEDKLRQQCVELDRHLEELRAEIARKNVSLANIMRARAGVKMLQRMYRAAYVHYMLAGKHMPDDNEHFRMNSECYASARKAKAFFNPEIRCDDGTQFSVSTGGISRCTPQGDAFDQWTQYSHVQVNDIVDANYAPLAPPEEWRPFAHGGFPSHTYDYVPIELVYKFMAEHGSEFDAAKVYKLLLEQPDSLAANYPVTDYRNTLERALGNAMFRANWLGSACSDHTIQFRERIYSGAPLKDMDDAAVAEALAEVEKKCSDKES